MSAASLLCGCNSIAGIHEGILDPCADSGACGGGGRGGATATSAAGPSSSSAATSSGAGSGYCGNGVIDPGEECDDGNISQHDGCTGCVVDCDGAGAFKDPIAHHCYRVNATKLNVLQAGLTCQMLGGYLAAITSPEELAAVSPHVTSDVWIGGSEVAMSGAYAWSNGEPWGYAPWRPGEPNGAAFAHACVTLAGPNPLGFADDSCDVKYPFLCERSPAGQAPP